MFNTKDKKQISVPQNPHDKLTRQEQEFLPGALAVTETPPSPLAYWLLWSIMGFIVIAVLWSAIGKVEEVAVAMGKVCPAGYTKTVQAEDKGVVKEIPVHDGQVVRRGDIILKLDTTMTEADLAQYKKERAYYELDLGRLTAEQNNRYFTFADYRPETNQEDIEMQRKLYKNRREEYRTRIKAVTEAIAQTEASIKKEKAVEDKYRVQLEIAKEQAEKMETLSKTGAVSLFQYQQYEVTRSEYQHNLDAQTMEILKLEHLLQQYKEEKQQIDKEYQKEIAAKIVEDRRQLSIIEESIRKAEEKNRLSIIRAPIDGRVQQLSVHTVGAIVTVAQELALIVPENTPMEIEAWIENKDIGFVYEGQEAAIKVESFNFQKYGILPAKVKMLSTEAVETKTGELKFKAIIVPQVAEFHLANGRIVPLSAGMSVTAEIKTREKRVIEYFLDPFIKYIDESLRER